MIGGSGCAYDRRGIRTIRHAPPLRISPVRSLTTRSRAVVQKRSPIVVPDHVNIVDAHRTERGFLLDNESEVRTGPIGHSWTTTGSHRHRRATGDGGDGSLGGRSTAVQDDVTSVHPILIE